MHKSYKIQHMLLAEMGMKLVTKAKLLIIICES
jgi:hypothetical protein